ncbi:MAG: M20 family metallopeptidase [Chloroflexi bacterium]|nr:M20 family metallopeptidase [Chloroflexota bacterium]
MTGASKLRAYLEARTDCWVDLLRTLVEHESGTYDKADVDVLGRLLQRRLDELGFATERAPQAKVGDHVGGRRVGSGQRRLLLVGHFDTVFSHGTLARRPFRVERGVAYGPGVYDMKGGLVIMLASLEALRETGSPAYDECGLGVILNSDEEILSPTSTSLIDAEARQSQGVCVLEPARAGGEYVLERKGTGKFFLTVHGRAAHAGVQPEKGASAILELAHKITQLHALTDPGTGTMVNVGVVQGGERSNIVCPEAYAEIDLRVTSMEAAEAAVQAVREIVGRSTVADTTAELRGGLDFPPLTRRPEHVRMFELVREAAREVGFEARGVATGGGSDANHAGLYAPVVDGMGIQGDGAHSDRELAEIASIAERAAVLATFIERWTARV